jgi:hypothetical protein
MGLLERGQVPRIARWGVGREVDGWREGVSSFRESHDSRGQDLRTIRNLD